MKQKIDKTNFFKSTYGIFELCISKEMMPKRNPDYISYKRETWHGRISDGSCQTLYLGDDKNIYYKDDDQYFGKFLFEDEDFTRYIGITVSSSYWYDEDYLYRRSDHWGEVSDCEWEITYPSKELIDKGCENGMIFWENDLGGYVMIGRIKWEDLEQIATEDDIEKLEGLSMFLPYDLKVKESKKIGTIGYLTKIDTSENVAKYSILVNGEEKETDFKPILRPFTTYEMKQLLQLEDEDNVIADVLYNEFESDNMEQNLNNLTKKNPYHFNHSLIKVLCKYHLDIFGWIEKDWAVDANDVF